MRKIVVQMSADNAKPVQPPQLLRLPRVLTTLLFALALAVGSTVIAPTAEAASRWREGWCKKDEGMSVVVDFSLTDPSEWPESGRPNGWIIRCYRGRSLDRFVGDGRTQTLEAVGLSYATSGGLVSEIEGVNGIGVGSGGWWFYITADLGAGRTTWGGGPAYPAGGDVTNLVQGVRFGTNATSPEPAPQYGPDTLSASAPPVISGTPGIGQKLTASPGSWNVNLDSVTYQWYRDGVPIDGATSAEYVLTDADGGKTITVKVIGSKTSYEAVEVGSSLVAVPVGTLESQDPVITGSAKVGGRLTADTVGWGPTPVSFGYQWLRAGAAIPGATASTYLVASSDVDQQLTVSVTGTKQGYATQTRTSAAVTGGLNLFQAATPKVTGTAKSGRTLTAKAGTWTPKPTSLSYQWYRWGKPIAGATKATYKLTRSDRKTEITVKVTGKAANYQTVTVSSAAVEVEFGTLKAARPKITGTAKVGKTLKATAGSWKPKPSGFSYRWYRSGKAIAGAIAPKYALVTADRGKEITVKVTGTKKGYKTKSAASKATARIR